MNILVPTPIFAGVRNPLKALCSVLDHYNMFRHTTYTFQIHKWSTIYQKFNSWQQTTCMCIVDNYDSRLMGNARFPRHNMNVLFIKMILRYIQGAPIGCTLNITEYHGHEDILYRHFQNLHTLTVLVLFCQYQKHVWLRKQKIAWLVNVYLVCIIV